MNTTAATIHRQNKRIIKIINNNNNNKRKPSSDNRVACYQSLGLRFRPLFPNRSAQKNPARPPPKGGPLMGHQRELNSFLHSILAKATLKIKSKTG